MLNQTSPTTVMWLGQAAVIEKGIPIPPKDNGRRPRPGQGAITAYPWDMMEVGDSFRALPCHSAPSIRNAAWAVSCAKGTDYTVRELPDGTIRVWRTK